MRLSSTELQSLAKQILQQKRNIVTVGASVGLLFIVGAFDKGIALNSYPDTGRLPILSEQYELADAEQYRERADVRIVYEQLRDPATDVQFEVKLNAEMFQQLRDIQKSTPDGFFRARISAVSNDAIVKQHALAIAKNVYPLLIAKQTGLYKQFDVHAPDFIDRYATMLLANQLDKARDTYATHQYIARLTRTSLWNTVTPSTPESALVQLAVNYALSESMQLGEQGIAATSLLYATISDCIKGRASCERLVKLLANSNEHITRAISADMNSNYLRGADPLRVAILESMSPDVIAQELAGPASTRYSDESIFSRSLHRTIANASKQYNGAVASKLRSEKHQELTR